ncbi:uncharacterized protein ARB_02810 [Trichophyton benhamiae CBS 112371]|uniref:Uncharacterized protein n=1 Tax=Arthroderma benhamiae (strain ATCC MYA-4681 / CBS 112371) TaxID=663331 RepID=D4B2X7_ARTBC|nr:uncharacterized protein ARB_02810 [Trichophyton benhamiae CBS 112371]EFE30273.1 hypothetical protein ARB_02810 [Trichophyton benhamiae CBS 112371]
MDWLFGTSIGDELEDDIPEQSNGESIAEKFVEKKPRRSHRRKTRENRYRYVVWDIRSGRQISLMSEGGEETEKEVACLVVIGFVCIILQGVWNIATKALDFFGNFDISVGNTPYRCDGGA